MPATQLLYRTQDEQGRPTATVTTVVNPTGPVNGGLVAYLSFYDALGDICSPSYTLQGGDRARPTPSWRTPRRRWWSGWPRRGTP